MDDQFPQTRNTVEPDDFEKLPKQPVSRRTLLKMGIVGSAATTLAGIDALAWAPKRVAQAASTATAFSDIQFDIGNFIAPAQTLNGILFRFGPVYTVFLTAQVALPFIPSDQDDMTRALNTIEQVYPFSPSGVFTFIAYGIPYFNKLPGGMSGSLVNGNIPHLLSNTSRSALEEAIPTLTDVSSRNPVIKKETFNVPVSIESNDLVFTFRSDSLNNINDVVNWLLGSDSLRGQFIPSPDFAFNGLLNFTTIRTQFVQIGLPRKVANQNNLSFAGIVDPQTPMWMGFSDQQVSASGPPQIVTFVGNSSARFTTATSGSYFDNGGIQHLSHVIQDLGKFYAKPDEPFTERVQYMFRSDPIPTLGNQSDQFTNGGGGTNAAFEVNDASVFLKYQAQGTTEAIQTALPNPNPVNSPQPPSSPNPADVGQRNPRMGHLSALQQVSRAPDGTPIHIRMDGPGFSAGDVPDGSKQPKLQFTIFVPTADFFIRMRDATTALNFQAIDPANPGRGGSANGTVASDDNGLERFLTATRRQNFLIPPRRHRAFPLLEQAFGNSSSAKRPLTRSKPVRNITVL
ncbi:MAG TPA: hypothetical protein VKR06_02225 [Ktedonosporobacter sp.]|nr:hypothetical protein [Ktedonosporobacter sp.]